MKKSLIYGVSTAVIFYIITAYILEPFGMFITYGMIVIHYHTICFHIWV